jgi:hypothetical protein
MKQLEPPGEFRPEFVNERGDAHGDVAEVGRATAASRASWSVPRSTRRRPDAQERGIERDLRRLPDPDGMRAHAPRERTYRLARVGATGTARSAKPLERRGQHVAELLKWIPGPSQIGVASAARNTGFGRPRRAARRGPARDRRRRKRGAERGSWARLARGSSIPDGTRAHAPERRRARIAASGRDVSNYMRRATATAARRGLARSARGPARSRISGLSWRRPSSAAVSRVLAPVATPC